MGNFMVASNESCSVNMLQVWFQKIWFNSGVQRRQLEAGPLGHMYDDFPPVINKVKTGGGPKTSMDAC
jgi:hypothetical protein